MHASSMAAAVLAAETVAEMEAERGAAETVAAVRRR
jgi:hypothetical protein